MIVGGQRDLPGDGRGDCQLTARSPPRVKTVRRPGERQKRRSAPVPAPPAPSAGHAESGLSAPPASSGPVEPGFGTRAICAAAATQAGLDGFAGYPTLLGPGCPEHGGGFPVPGDCCCDGRRERQVVDSAPALAAPRRPRTAGLSPPWRPRACCGRGVLPVTIRIERSPDSDFGYGERGSDDAQGWPLQPSFWTRYAAPWRKRPSK